MAGDSIQVKIKDKATPALRAMAKRGRSPRPVLRVIGQIGVEAVEENFQQEGRPKWKPLKKPRPGKILTISSSLRHSVHYRIKGNKEVRVGTNVIYASVHNRGYRGRQQVRAHTKRVRQAFGRSIPETSVAVSAFSRMMRIPQREFLVIPAEDQREIDRTVEAFIMPRDR